MEFLGLTWKEIIQSFEVLVQFSEPLGTVEVCRKQGNIFLTQEAHVGER